MASNRYPEVFDEMVETFKSLPGIGRRSAERICFAILKWPPEKTRRLGQLLAELPEKLTRCPECSNLATDGGLCPICSDQSRDRSSICVVEEPSQIHNIENSGLFKGLYHITGGKFSPLKGREIHDLNLDQLVRRVGSGTVKEVILALSCDLEGQATSIYIADLLKDKNVRTTRLAQGLPVGSDISFADSATLAAALSGRTGLNPPSTAQKVVTEPQNNPPSSGQNMEPISKYG